MAWYYLSLGSNIHPRENVKRILDHLLKLTNRIDISRILETKAKGFETDNIFLNLAARIYSPLSAKQLKQQFNKIEIQLGRDRSDPMSKKKDRPADIDILFVKDTADSPVGLFELPEEPYVRPFVNELLTYLHGNAPEKVHFEHPGISLNYHNGIIGKHPVSLNRVAEDIILPSSPMKAAG